MSQCRHLRVPQDVDVGLLLQLLQYIPRGQITHLEISIHHLLHPHVLSALDLTELVSLHLHVNMQFEAVNTIKWLDGVDLTQLEELYIDLVDHNASVITLVLRLVSSATGGLKLLQIRSRTVSNSMHIAASTSDAELLFESVRRNATSLKRVELDSVCGRIFWTTKLTWEELADSINVRNFEEINKGAKKLLGVDLSILRFGDMFNMDSGSFWYICVNYRHSTRVMGRYFRLCYPTAASLDTLLSDALFEIEWSDSDRFRELCHFIIDDMLPKALEAPPKSLSIDALRSLTLLIVRFINEEDREKYYDRFKQLVIQHNELLALMEHTEMPVRLLHPKEGSFLTDLQIKINEKDEHWTTATFFYIGRPEVLRLIFESPRFNPFQVDHQGNTIMEKMLLVSIEDSDLVRQYLNRFITAATYNGESQHAALDRLFRTMSRRLIEQCFENQVFSVPLIDCLRDCGCDKDTFKSLPSIQQFMAHPPSPSSVSILLQFAAKLA
jgi:hypothetical protein